jgi:hypothetical protein
MCRLHLRAQFFSESCMIWRDETTIRSRIDANITVFLGSNLRPTKEFMTKRR